MSLSQPSMRLCRPYKAASLASTYPSPSKRLRPHFPTCSYVVPKLSRHASTDPGNDLVARYEKKREQERRESSVASDSTMGISGSGSLPKNSIFNMPKARSTSGSRLNPELNSQIFINQLSETDMAGIAKVLDPKPENTMLWERRRILQSVRRNGRASRAVRIKRTEREHLARSPVLKTSIKKLMFLARQIAGKTVEEALLQMRLSKKKPAVEIGKFLELARDEAIVAKGMGLGKAEGTAGNPVKIELKSGRSKTVNDRTEMYIAQAWVGRGKYTIDYDHRARGVINILKRPFTSISVILKEEATRIRLSDEYQKKRDQRPIWTQLKNRAVSTQRQYCLW